MIAPVTGSILIVCMWPMLPQPGLIRTLWPIAFSASIVAAGMRLSIATVISEPGL